MGMLPFSHSETVVLTLHQAAERCPSLNVATSLGFVVAGCSAGANCTASMVLRARDDPFFAETPITGQLLEIPLVVHPYARLPEKYVHPLSCSSCVLDVYL